MQPTLLDVHFDFISLHAYFAWRRVTAMSAARGVTLVAHPVV
jgi:2-hydroxychromene-2-carboxylate isomerase